MRWLLLCSSVCVLPLAYGQDRQERRKALFMPLPAIPVAKLNRANAVDFAKEILPILETKCLYCHSGAVKEGRYDMEAYAGLLKGGKTGVAIVPGKPDEGTFFKLAARTAVPPMPPRDEVAFTPAELGLVRLWIEQGAKASAGEGRAVAKTVVRPRALPAKLQGVTALALTRDGKLLAAGQAGKLHLFDPATGQRLRSLVDEALVDQDSEVAGKKPLGVAQWDQVHALAFTPDGKVLAAAGFQEVRLWQVESGKLLHKLGGFQDRVWAVDFSPDGKLLAVAGGPPTADAELQLVDWSAGKVVAAVKAPHSDSIYAVRFRPDGTRVATAGADRFLRVFTVPGGQLEKSFEGHTQAVLAVDWRADGQQLVSAGADQAIKVWDYQTGDQVRSMPAPGREINRLVMLQSQPWALTCAADGQAKVWDVGAGRAVRGLEGATNALQALAATPDGKLLATAGLDSIIRVYSAVDGKLLRSIPTVGP